jgi:hypothetical protein
MGRVGGRLLCRVSMVQTMLARRSVRLQSWSWSSGFLFDIFLPDSWDRSRPKVSLYVGGTSSVVGPTPCRLQSSNIAYCEWSMWKRWKTTSSWKVSQGVADDRHFRVPFLTKTTTRATSCPVIERSLVCKEHNILTKTVMYLLLGISKLTRLCIVMCVAHACTVHSGPVRACWTLYVGT